MGSMSRRSRDEEKAQRLFIITPKGISEDCLYDEFSKYGKIIKFKSTSDFIQFNYLFFKGEIDDINMIRDRKTKDGKGFAYITYKKYVVFFELFILFQFVIFFCKDLAAQLWHTKIVMKSIKQYLQVLLFYFIF